MTRETLANQNRTEWKTADAQRERIEAAQEILKEKLAWAHRADPSMIDEFQKILRALGCPACDDHGGQERMPVTADDLRDGSGPRYRGVECELCGRMGEDE